MHATKYVTAFAMLATAILGPVAPQAASADDALYRIEVFGGSDEFGLNRLKLFYERLLIELGVDDLGYVNVGCDKCGELESGPPEGKLVFALERDGLTLPAFMNSYHLVQTYEQMAHETFSMTINGKSPSGACPNPIPAGCRNRPICNMYNGCDKPYGGPCAPCQ